MNKILVIDDSEDSIKQTIHLLHRHEYQTGFILEPKFAIPRLLYEEFQLILLDIYMPEIDGISLLKEIKNHEKLKDIPVIMLTHDTDEELLLQCFQEGAVDFIHKPLNEKVLMSRVQTVLANRKYIQEIEEQNATIAESERLISKLYSQIMKDLDKARKTQYSLVSLQFPEFQSCSLHSYYKPMEKVGGDFICFEHEGEQRIDCFFGDVSGHGVSSAMVSCMAILAFKIAFEKKLMPREALIFIHELLFPVINHHFIVGCYLSYFPQERLLQYSYAGSPVLLVRDGRIENLPGEGTGLLMFAEKKFNSYEIELKKEDRILLYSDGLIEVFKDEEMYSFARFEESVLRHHKQQGEQYMNKILQDTLDFCDGSLRDDLTMFLLEVL